MFETSSKLKPPSSPTLRKRLNVQFWPWAPAGMGKGGQFPPMENEKKAKITGKSGKIEKIN